MKNLLDKVILMIKLTNPNKGHWSYQVDEFTKAVKNHKFNLWQKQIVHLHDIFKLHSVSLSTGQRNQIVKYQD